MAKESVKSICEDGIKRGRTHGVIMNTLRKKFDKDDDTYNKSIKYYASALHRKGDIDDDAKAKYVDGVGRKKSAAVSKTDAKSSKKTAKGKAKNKSNDGSSKSSARKSKRKSKSDNGPENKKAGKESNPTKSAKKGKK